MTLHVVSIRVTRAMKDALEAKAIAEERSLSSLCVRILRDHVAREQRQGEQAQVTR